MHALVCVQRVWPAGLVFFMIRFFICPISLTCSCLDHPSLANHACWDIQSVFSAYQFKLWRFSAWTLETQRSGRTSTNSTTKLLDRWPVNNVAHLFSVTCKNSSGLWKLPRALSLLKFSLPLESSR